MQRDSPSQTATRAARPCGDVNDLLTAARTRAGGPPTLAEMASLAHFSPFHLSRLLRDRLGYPLRDFLAALRVERGVESLLEGHPVTRSQQAAGHESASSYHRAFLRHTGMSPSHYRSQLGFLAAHLVSHMGSPDQLTVLHRRPPHGACQQPHPLKFRVSGAQPDSAIFAALNPTPNVKGAPALGVAMLRTAEFEVTEIPDGSYYAMAVEIPRAAGPRGYFQLERNRRQILRRPITFPLAQPMAITLELRDLLPTDPPITLNLPQLFFEGIRDGLVRQVRN